MMNRRQFVYAGVAAAALFGHVSRADAATYDLLIKGGRVIDPSAGLDAVRDVAIVRGKSRRSRRTSPVTLPRRSMRAERLSRRA